MKRRMGILVLVLVLGMLAVGLLPAAAQAEADVCLNKYGMWDAEAQKCLISSGVTVDIDYPLAFAEYPAVAAVIDGFMAEQQQAFIASYAPDFSLPAYMNKWALNIFYESYQFSDDVRTLVFTMSYYTGGAHPNSGYKTMTFDVAQGKQLELADLFVGGVIPWETISTFVQDDLNTRLVEMTDADTIAMGTGTNPEHYHSWALTPDSLLFFFDPYQVAAYAAGPQQSAIPLSTFAGQLNAPFG